MRKQLIVAVGMTVGMLALPLATLAMGAGAGAGGGAGAGASVGGASATVSASAGAGLGTQDQTRDRIQDPTTHTGTEPDQTRDQDRLHLMDGTGTGNTATTTAAGTGSMNQNQYQGGSDAGQGAMVQNQYQLRIDPEHLQVRAGATNGAQLGQMIQVRAQQLEQEASSTTPQARAAMQNANQVRLAVHAFLAAQGLLGQGIGAQVAQVANQIDNSVQATANAELQAQTRGFWARLFFGGDAAAGNTISQEVAQNQARIQTLTQLLSQTSSTPEVQAQLQTQLQTMTQEQDRLNQLAEKEKSQWGIFSWRF